MWARRDGAVRSSHGRNIRRPLIPTFGEFFPIPPPDHRPIRMAAQDIAKFFQPHVLISKHFPRGYQPQKL
ncbi:hypothetical protein SprV_0501962200 [Sparganum proliferum]